MRALPRQRPATSSALSLSRRRLLAGGLGVVGAHLTFPLSTSTVHAQRDAVDTMVSRMSLTEKIGQLFVIQAAGTVMPGWFADLLFGVQPGGVIFVAPNIGYPEQIRSYINAIQQTGRHIPPFVSVDQEGGPVARVPGDPVPGATYLGTLRDEEVRAYAKQRAQFLGDFGFNVNFAPVADVAFSPYSTMVYRSFGNDPRVVGSKIDAAVRGSRAGGVASAAKHFPGHGRTQNDSHRILPRIDVSFDEWLSTDAIPFQAAVDAEVEMVMFGHLEYIQWDTTPTSLSRVAVRVLRDELGYDGVIITDDLGMGALAGVSPYDLVDRGLDAGIDLLLYTSSPVHFGELVSHIQGRVERGDLDEAEIEASVRRILKLKQMWFSEVTV